MSSDCLFCKIVAGEIPVKKVYEDEFVIGFLDIAPLAKIHLLFINKVHSTHLNEMSLEQLVQTMSAITRYSEDNDLVKSGYRVVTNIGPDAGQTVFHTHFHLLSGEKLDGFGSKKRTRK